MVSCAAPRANTTELRSEDLVRMSDELTESLATSPAILARDPEDSPWIISLQRVRNETSHLMSDDRAWLVMTRLRSRLAQSAMPAERAIRFVLPPEEWNRYDSTSLPGDARRLDPTHTLTATFYSDTTSSMKYRADAYLCAFQLTNLSTGQIIWEDDYEVRYSIVRNRFD